MASRPAPASLAQRFVMAATALMPASRRDWGRAITAELACTTSPAERARLVLAAVRIVLLTPPGFFAGLREYARTAGRSAVLALIAYIPIGLVLYLLTVVFPAAQVAIPAVFGYGYPLAVLLTAGARARRASARIGAPIVAGLAAGLVLAILAVATVAVLDNAFLSVISQQPDNIEKFRASGMTSMRAYLNSDLESITPVVTAILAIAGAVFAPLGAVLAKALAPATAEAPARLHRIPRKLPPRHAGRLTTPGSKRHHGALRHMLITATLGAGVAESRLGPRYHDTSEPGAQWAGPACRRRRYHVHRPDR